jgi:hypothetical protein
LQAKGRQSRPAGSQRPGCSGVRSSVSETRGNGGAFRDRSSHPWPLSFGHPWPNRSLQAPPLPRSLGSGTATGQKDLSDLSTKWGLWRRIFQGAPGSGVPVQDRLWPGMAKAVRRPAELTGTYLQRVLEGHTRSRCGLSGEKDLWSPAGNLCRELRSLSRARPAPTIRATTRGPAGGPHPKIDASGTRRWARGGARRRDRGG